VTDHAEQPRTTEYYLSLYVEKPRGLPPQSIRITLTPVK
jgi:hypothetical protein